MLKKCLSALLSSAIIITALPMGTVVCASGVEDGEGTWASPYVVTDAQELASLLEADGSDTVYIRLGSDIVTEAKETMNVGDVLRNISVRGKKCLDLSGHTLRSKLPFNTKLSRYSLFVIRAEASFILEDSDGNGEVIFDRYIPDMGKANEQTEIFLDRPLNVFDVSGELTVNGGEVTAGHYESEYYTYTDGYIYNDSSPTPGTVNSITPGNAVIVRTGGSFTSNGGEYYGRGFIMDDEGGKEVACTAVSLYNDARATINAGSFYGKSNADVFSIDPTASVTVYSGNFYARYDNRITVDKMNGIAYYVNTDCGRIGIPLRAFKNEMETFTHIYVDGREFNYTSDYTQSDDEWFIDLGSDGTGADVTVETLSGNGTQNEPFLLKNASDVNSLFRLRRLSKTYIRLENDIDDCTGDHSVYGNYILDLNGHKLGGKLGANDWHPSYSLFIVTSGSSMTIEDSAGDGEIIFDRRIPSMDETNEQTDIFLCNALTVFDVRGNLTVNSGEITAGHYESEYYTYTKKYLTSGSTSAGTVNSIVPGCAVAVRDGGRFTSNGGEYYGRGFTIDDNGEKDDTCSAVRLHNGAAAIINDGDFYGKSNADVFSVPWGANVFVYSGRFEAQYDNRITVDKTNGTAWYVNVDCGKVGLPLRAFCHSRTDREIIMVNSEEYSFSADFTEAQSNAFENLGADGTGATVTASPRDNGSSRLAREDGVDTSVVLTYSPTDHFEIINEDVQYFSESFAPLPDPPAHVISYFWRVTRQGSSGWEDVGYKEDAPVSNGYYLTDTNRLDLYELARALRGGMVHGASYRIEGHTCEYWKNDDIKIYTVSSNLIETDCVFERIGNIDLSDEETGIEWPEYGKKPVNVNSEQDAFTASFTFEEKSADGVRYVPMSERSKFSFDGSYRMKVQITPKQFYRADPENSITIGGKAVTDITLSGGVMTGYISDLEVLPARITYIPLRGGLYDGVTLSAASPISSPISGVTVSTVWYKNNSAFTGAASYGDYRARITLRTQSPYIFTDETTVSVFGKDYTLTDLSSDCLSGIITTDMQHIACGHSGNTNGYSYDAENHYVVCSVCQEELSRGVHTFGSWTHNGGNDERTCSVCGYKESVSNGKSYAPCIRLTADTPKAGDPLPYLAICEEDDKYAVLEQDAEWFIDEVNFTNAIPQETVMEDGHVYYAQLKLHPKSDYYFTSETGLGTTNILASSIEHFVVEWNYMEAILSFTPRTYAKADFMLGDRKSGQTFREFLSGFDTMTDGKHTSVTFAIFRDDSYEAGLVYTYATDSWWIASGDADEFLARTMQDDAEYRIVITLTETGKYFDPADITVSNASAAAEIKTVGGNLGCTVTAYYRLSPVGFEGASITLQNDLKENFFVDKEEIAKESYTDLFTVFEINGKTVRVSDHREVTSSGKTFLVFSLPDIAPDQMNDLVKATFHASKDGKSYVSEPKEYSAAAYCYSMLEKTDDEKLRTLLVDLLNYGAAAQEYTGYKTDEPANKDLTAVQKAWGTSSDPKLNSVKDSAYRTVDSPSAEWAGVSLRLGDTVTMRFAFTAADTEGITVRFEDTDGTILSEITSEELHSSGGYYFAEYSGLTAGEMSKTVCATVYRGDKAISSTAAYSVESYASAKQNDENEKLATLVMVLMKYGNSAYSYAH